MANVKNQNPGELNSSQVQGQGSDSELEELKKKAEAGDADAQYQLGFAFEESGKIEDAKDWYKVASDSGNWMASKKLSVLLPSVSSEYFEKMIVQRNDYYGIHAFDNPADAWEIMQDYSKHSKIIRYLDYFNVLDDRHFENALLYRAADCLCKGHFGLITEEECEKRLCISTDEASHYILDFDFFYYSEKSGHYYASIVNKKDDHVNAWSECQWDAFHELNAFHDFGKIYEKARDFFQRNLEDINECGADAYMNVFEESEEFLLMYFCD